MPSPLAAHLAGRFAADARGLRARAAALAGARPTGGPNAATYARMAEACDRMERLFGEEADGAPDDDALRALLPRLAGLLAGAKGLEERNVYAGAVARLTEGLDGGEDADDSADDEDDG